MKPRLLLVLLLLAPHRAPAQGTISAEERLVAQLSTERISQFHRMLTRRPHLAGTPGGRAVAEQIAATLRGFGLETELRAYHPWLSHPRRIRLSLLRPAQRVLPVYERGDPRDPDSGHPRPTPGFIAYSPSGRVRAPVVYVNYGLPGDYEALEAAGVSVRGAIALARYGKAHRAVKVHTAEQRGARGVILYSDPADDGYAQGDPWPAGPWRASWFLQRGNAKYSWFWHGDPLTPHAPATREAERRKPEEVPTLPRIPAVATSWSAAQQILSRLQGPAVPRGFQGALPFTYHTGPGPAEIEMDVQMDSGLRPIFNVLARLQGKEQPDRWVILGTHHDAWTFGGVDPGSAAAVVLELAQALGQLHRSGWRPRRSILLAFWDAEEYGLIGSTEYAEEFAGELREKAVAYINSDLYLAGPLRAGGAASLRDLVADVVGSPLELAPLGSGADFVPFQAFLGLPTLSLEFGPGTSYGAYHSTYDTRRYMEKLGDPGWRYGRALAELLGRTVLRLAESEVLPFRFSHTAEKLEEYLRELEGQYGRDLGLETTRARLAAFGEQARRLERAVAAGELASGAQPEFNDRLVRAEKSFVVEDERWYRHTVYGWNIYALYSGQTLPALRAALERRDQAAFAAERARLELALERATAELTAAAALLR